MLSAAIDLGIGIIIHDPTGRDAGLENRLKDAFGLRDGRVALCGDGFDRDDPPRRVGALAAQRLLACPRAPTGSAS